MSTETNQELKSAREDFVEALYDNVRQHISPTPVIEIQDNENDTQINHLDGRGILPSENSIEIDVLDLNIASIFLDDFHLLYEGETQTGKTLNSETLFGALFEEEAQYNVRLSDDPAGPSPLDPFIEDEPSGTSLKRKVDENKARTISGVHMDEINRGKDDDLDDLLQILDGNIKRGGETTELGIPIPETDRLKKPVIISTVNPDTAEYTGTDSIDLAGEERFLKIQYPNIGSEAGSTLMDKQGNGELHEQFWEDLRNSSTLDTELEKRQVYAQLTDPELVDLEFDERQREFVTCSLGYFAENMQEEFSANLGRIQQAGYEPKFDLRQGHELQAIQDQKKELRNDINPGDIDKVRNIGRLLTLIRKFKEGEEDCQEVSGEDTVAALGLALESKTTTDAEYGSMMSLVNDTRSAYDQILDELDVPETHNPDTSEAAYPGVRDSFLASAIHSGVDSGFEGYLGDLEQHIDDLNDYNNNNAEALIRSRLMADMSVLENFSRNHRGEIEDALEQSTEEYESKREADLAAWQEFQDIYQEHKSDIAIYDHRLGWIEA